MKVLDQISEASTTSVLVVGAGPSGLMMAHELVRYGISVIIIDMNEKKSPYSRAIGVQARSLEIFDALGLIDSLLQKALSINGVKVYIDKKDPILLPVEKTSSFFLGPQIIDQPHTEEVLENALEKMGCRIFRGIELIDFTSDDEGITARLGDGLGNEISRRFSYLVGADGAHSTIRKKIKGKFLGSGYDDAFILADAICDNSLNHDSFCLFLNKKNFFATIPMIGKDHFRLLSVRPNEKSKEGLNPQIEEFKKLAQICLPFPINIKEATWLSRFFVQCRVVDKYQQGLTFLVGDAAHIHSPAGGQGMNTGLQDSFNLAWKLAMVLKKVASTKLLATYHQERKPVGDFLIKNTDRFFKFMVKSGFVARLMRLLALPLVARSKIIKEQLFIILSQTAINYSTGAMCPKGLKTKIGQHKVGSRIKNLMLISDDLKKTDVHKIVSNLGFSLLIFIPIDISKKALKEIEKTALDVKRGYTLGLCSHLIFFSDFDAEGLTNNTPYWVAKKPDPDFLHHDPYYVVARPDHHIFCMGLLNHIDHVRSCLASYIV